jgi:hypothetical protein
MGRTPSEYRLRLERLRIARNNDELRDATDTFLQHHQLPDDPDILTKVMQHPSEKVVREAMGQISALLMQGRMAASPAAGTSFDPPPAWRRAITRTRSRSLRAR